MSVRFDGEIARQWLRRATEAVGAVRAEINRANVYPVPDADTGSNLYYTLVEGCSQLDAYTKQHLARGMWPAAILQQFARGCMLWARGNSGVMVSEYLRSLAQTFRRSIDPQISAEDLAFGLDRAGNELRFAVARPVEGTMLTVAREAGRAAVSHLDADPDATVFDVASAAASAAHACLARTPELLPVLRRARVVDAGGAGLVVVLDALVAVLSDSDEGENPMIVVDSFTAGGNGDERPVQKSQDDRSHPDGHGHFEVMFVMRGSVGSAIGVDVEVAARSLRDRLSTLGDSVVVVGEDDLWHVHLHTDDPRAAIETGPHAVMRPAVVSYLPHRTERSAPPERALMIVTASVGLADTYARMSDLVLVTPDGLVPTVEEMDRAAAESGATTLIIATAGDFLAEAAHHGSEGRVDAPASVSICEAPSELHLIAAAMAYREGGDEAQVLADMRDAIAGVRELGVDRAVLPANLADVETMTIIVDRDVSPRRIRAFEAAGAVAGLDVSVLHSGRAGNELQIGVE